MNTFQFSTIQTGRGEVRWAIWTVRSHSSPERRVVKGGRMPSSSRPRRGHHRGGSLRAGRNGGVRHGHRSRPRPDRRPGRSSGRRIVASVADTRDLDALKSAVDAGVEKLGRLDIVIANAGIAASAKLSWDLSAEEFRELMDINVTGVWLTTKVSIPHIMNGNRGGSIVLISSMAGLRGVPGIAHYSASKHAVRGVGEVSGQRTRLGRHPSQLRTPGQCAYDDDRQRTDDSCVPSRLGESCPRRYRSDHVEAESAAPHPWVDPPEVIADAVFYLVGGPAGRGITGIALPIDLGTSEKFAGG